MGFLRSARNCPVDFLWEAHFLYNVCIHKIIPHLKFDRRCPLRY